MTLACAPYSHAAKTPVNLIPIFQFTWSKNSDLKFVLINTRCVEFTASVQCREHQLSSQIQPNIFHFRVLSTQLVLQKNLPLLLSKSDKNNYLKIPQYPCCAGASKHDNHASHTKELWDWHAFIYPNKLTTTKEKRWWLIKKKNLKPVKDSISWVNTEQLKAVLWIRLGVSPCVSAHFFIQQESWESSVSRNAKYGRISLFKGEREGAASCCSECDWCGCSLPVQMCVCSHMSPSMCLCAWGYNTASMTSALHLGLRLKLLEPLYVTQGQWRTLQHTYICVCVCVWRISNVTKRHRQKADMGANRSYPHLNRAAWLLHVRMCYESEYGRRHMTVTWVSCSVSTFYRSQRHVGAI